MPRNRFVKDNAFEMKQKCQNQINRQITKEEKRYPKKCFYNYYS